jgi:uncharacterized protein
MKTTRQCLFFGTGLASSCQDLHTVPVSLHEDAFIPVLDLLDKYAGIPMSIADACLVRLTEVLPDPLLLTTDSDFKIYRRLGRRVIPTRMP